MASVLPACIRVNARPFTVRQFGALMLDELDEIAHERHPVDNSRTPPEAWPHRVWWMSISEAERAKWRLWLRTDIQADEVGPAMRGRK
jgi:hypothetical protein